MPVTMPFTVCLHASGTEPVNWFSPRFSVCTAAAEMSCSKHGIERQQTNV